MLVAVRGTKAGVATFENFDEGVRGISFVDPVSGVAFSEPTTPQIAFCTEYGAALPSAPTILPGHYLVGDGFVPGDLILVSTNFGFTATLPSAAQVISFDFIYAQSGTVTIQAFDSGNQLVASNSIIPPAGNFVEGHLELQCPSPTIVKFKVIASTISIGYDNITFNIPEPAAIYCAAAMTWAASRRSRKR
jgi:hypothetical protein